MINNNTNRALRFSSLLLAMALSMCAAIAQTVWTGAQSSDYFNADNWSNGLPAVDNNAIIPGGTSVNIDQALNADYDIASFGSITATANIDVRGTLSSSGGLTTTATINVFGAFESLSDLDMSASARLNVVRDATFRSNATVTNAGIIYSKGSMINDGTINIAANARIVSYETGTFNNSGVLNLDGLFNNRNDAKYTAPSGGTINVKEGARINNLTGASIRNAGQINIAEGGFFIQKAILENVPGRIFVAGRLITYEGSVTRSNFLTVQPTGRLEATQGDTFAIVFSLVNEGRVFIGVDATIGGLLTNKQGARVDVFGNGTLDFVAGTNLTNEGVFVNKGILRSVGTLTNDDRFYNLGTIVQNNGGTIANNSLFVNRALIENVNRIINNDRFKNESRITNNSGGTIENNSKFVNQVDAHIQNLFEIYNKGVLDNRGYFENGVSLFNESRFNNFGFLTNVGDIFNNPAGEFYNFEAGVVDNSGAGIFTNEGLIDNRGEINNFNCGIIDNNGSIINQQWISNEGIFYQNGSLTGKPLMGSGPVVAEGGSSPLICQPFKQKVDQLGKTTVSGTRFAAPRFDSCQAITYLMNGEETMDFTCADIGVHQIILTLVDRRGNEINCGTTLTITDENAPRIDSCPVDVVLADVSASDLPIAAQWTPPTFTDDCDSDVTVVATHNPGDRFPEGQTAVLYTATDDYGNEFICSFNVIVSVKEEGCTPKNDDGLLAYYNFSEGADRHVFDRSGYARDLHMEIKDQNGIKWDNADCGLTNTAHRAIVKSYGNSHHLGEAIKMTNALTVEAWVKPSDVQQNGPARIVTFSKDIHERNFTLGQQNGKYIFRLRTTRTNHNGESDRVANGADVRPGQEQYIVFTRDASGKEEFYVDGQLAYSGTVGGNLSNWNSSYYVAFFNEMTLDRSWKGGIKKIAIYDRAWSRDEVSTNRERGACGCDDSPRGNTCQGDRGQVTYERFDNIGGNDLDWLYKAAKYPSQPDATAKLTELRIPSDAGSDYGSRTRGWIYPTHSGYHRFGVTGDDAVNLMFSYKPDDASAAYVIAYHQGYTSPTQLDRYATQKSGQFWLIEGKGYYFEFFQKEGAGGDHGAVYWQQPGNNHFEVIGAANIGDIKLCNDGVGVPTLPSDCVSPKGGLLREVWTGIHSNDIWELMADPRYPNNPTSTNIIEAYCGPRNAGDGYGTRVRGYIHPDVTGDYVFTITGDDQTKLMLSTDEKEANARQIAIINGWTGTHEYHKYSTQISVKIRLEAGKRYYTELLHQEGRGGDFFNVFWQTPTNHTRQIVPGNNLSPYKDCSGENGTACNTDVLFVVGHVTLNNGDATVKRRLHELGYNVTVTDAHRANSAMAEGKGLVVISSTVHSVDVGAKFRDVKASVILWESWLYDDMRMTGNNAGHDYGIENAEQATILGAGDVLAANGSGTKTVYTSHHPQHYGNIEGSAGKVIAHIPGNAHRATIFSYDKGDKMKGGLNAPGIRIGFYIDGDGAAHWSSYGRNLFDAAVKYATFCTDANNARVSLDVLTLNATQRTSQVDLVWTANTAFKTTNFLVERSNDDVNYFVIDEVAVTEEGDEMKAYSYVDVAPKEGDNYYRITAVYTTGDDAQSELRLINYRAQGNVNVYPNPASEEFTLSFDGFDNREVEVTMTDALGRNISTQTVLGNDGQLSVDVRNLANGWYGVTVTSGDFQSTKKLFVAHE